MGTKMECCVSVAASDIEDYQQQMRDSEVFSENINVAWILEMTLYLGGVSYKFMPLCDITDYQLIVEAYNY